MMTVDPYIDDFDDYEYDDEDHGWGCECEECRMERAYDECGRLPDHLGGGCQLAGTEHCYWVCPFRDGFDDEESE